MYEDFERDDSVKENSNRIDDINDSAPKNEESRRSKVENFKVEFSDEEFYSDVTPSKHRRASKDKGIYFSNWQNRRNQSSDGEPKGKLDAHQKKWLIIVSVIVVCTVSLSLYTLSCLNDILGITKSTDNVTVTIPKDADQKEILKILKDEKLISHPHFDRLFINSVQFMRDYSKRSDETSTFEFLKDRAKNGSGVKYVDGMYDVNAKMGVETMMNRFKPNKKSNETITLSFPEGWTVQQIAKRLDKAGVCDEKLFYQTLKTGDFSEFSFVKPAFENSKKYIPLEGYLYPDTYEFYLNETASSVIRRFLKNFDEKFPQKYRDRAKELGMSVDQVITLASIIEKEAADTSQMKIISGVFHNRLKDPTNFPLIGSDATSDYVKNYIKPNVSNEAYTAYKAAYDTYNSACRGLPAGPICNPGKDAIEAALYPKETDYLYFCHNFNGDGKLYLAKTYEKHNQNKLKAMASLDNN